MTWTDRIALLRIFLAWLFGSVLFGYTVDKLSKRIKKRRPCYNKVRQKRKLSQINCIRKQV